LELNILQMGVYFCNEIYTMSLFHPEHDKLTVAADTSSAGVQEYRDEIKELLDFILIRRGWRRG
jgi:hypothetical protein